jgi:hypothetical protein
MQEMNQEQTRSGEFRAQLEEERGKCRGGWCDVGVCVVQCSSIAWCSVGGFKSHCVE